MARPVAQRILTKPKIQLETRRESQNMPYWIRAIWSSEIALFLDDWASLLRQKRHFRLFVRCFLSQFCEIGTITKVSDRPHKFVRITNLWDHNFVRITILWDHKIVRSQSQNVLTKSHLITNRAHKIGEYNVFFAYQYLLQQHTVCPTR